VTTGDGGDGVSLVRSELEQGLPELDPIQFEVDADLTDGPLQAVAWTYTAKPRPGALFLGAQLTDAMTLRGVTLIKRGPDNAVLLRWYIDWLDALNRSGLNAAFRPVPDGRQPDLASLLSLFG
jgi:hypothetical protein